MTDFIKDKIFNYGSAITIGVFIGSALTTGILCGAGTYYIITKNVINKILTPIKTIIPNNLNILLEDTKIKNIANRIDQLEKEMKILKQ
jgi:hypothetical protein